MPRERCHRCYTILTSEDKHHYTISCESCECDMEWEDHERDRPVKSAYWRWRAICFVMRWLWCSVAGYRSLRLHLMPRPVDASRPKFQANRRGR
nr:MAG TPA: DNA-directed RNA polymerase [Bacteriophage sp.]